MAKKKSSVATIGLGYRLSSHEKLCAERMKQLLKSIDELKKNVASLNDSMSKGKGCSSSYGFRCFAYWSARIF